MATRKTTAPSKPSPAKKKSVTPSKPRPKSIPASADEVDTQLARYRSMRDFALTAEPAGNGDRPATAKSPSRTAKKPSKSTAEKRGPGLPFVIQKHAASHLHYDFRLGWNGVLKSWAVAKGPSYVVADKRLAVEVEDHPMEYGGFEGIIPKGQYGGGTVMVWDQGTWWPQPGYENIEAGLREGSLKFELNGTKLKGKWALIRMKPRPGSRWGNSSKPNWLLIKEHDPYERPESAPPITEEAPNSAVTGRTMDQIAHESDHVWNSKATATPGQSWYRQSLETPAESGTPPSSKSSKQTKSGPAKGAALISALKKFPRETQPTFLAPQLAEEATTPPEGHDWLHELKLDGYRIQARKSSAKIQLLTRKGLDWTHRMPAVADAIRRLPATNAILDGEVVVLQPDGTTSFADLQASFNEGSNHPLTYFAFDLLHLEGHNLRDAPLRDRKALLAQILPSDDETLRLSEHIEGNGLKLFHQACKHHAEGIVSKHADAAYHSGRTSAWLKSKCLREQEFAIGGFTNSSEGQDRIGSLLLGYYDQAGQLIYAGRTGTGFTQKSRADLRRKLEPLRLTKPVFASVPVEARRGAIWVKPVLVGQVRFATWTADNLVRQAAFLGLREDKPAAEVRREEPTVAPSPKASHRADGTKKAASKSANGASHPSPGHRPGSASDGSDRGLKARSQKAEPMNFSSSIPPIRLTHPDKILDTETHLTKAELAAYYWAIAPRLLPHIVGRPISLVRCPEGAGHPCFFQKHVTHMLPKGIGSVMIKDKKSDKPEPYITLERTEATAEALTSLAQLGVLEIHPWGSRNDNLEQPDRLIFDLDPDESLPWSTLCEAAAEVRSRLKKSGLASFLKLTGGKGLHIVAPIEPEHDWPTVKDLAHRFVDAMARAKPALYLTKMTKSERTGRIYLDYLRNERGATAVAPYSPRARAGVHVSLPLPWSALKLPSRPVYTVHDFASWQPELKPDPWKDMLTTSQRLDPKTFAQT
jgi:bifunctional non-homologous end joining protein LigD